MICKGYIEHVLYELDNLYKMINNEVNYGMLGNILSLLPVGYESSIKEFYDKCKSVNSVLESLQSAYTSLALEYKKFEKLI